MNLPRIAATPLAAFALGGMMAAAQAPAALARTTVVYAQGQLEVTAENASLNQVLHAVAGKIGMRIKGSVADQPVYGHYGPAAPAAILATLLEGTGSNMMLTASASGAPAELVLTPRQGPATPPAPASAALAQPEAVPAGQPVASGGAGVGGTPAAGTSDQPPPARTPQQIYEHLQKLRAMQHGGSQ